MGTLASIEESVGINPDKAIYISLSHSDDVLENGKVKWQASDAWFNNFYNLPGKAITVMSAEGPSYASLGSQLLVPLKAWSDLTFLEWEHLCKTHKTSVTGLQHVFHSHIINDDTLHIIRKALGEDDGFDNWKKYEKGYSFKASGDAFKALIGTPNASGAAWMLIQHKPQLGVKSISEIVIFGQYIDIEGLDPTWEAAMMLKIEED